MFHTDCPSCGATTEFKSSASVMAVCGYCQSTVYKDASAAAEVGKIGQVLEDYSPIQIGTSGIFNGLNFSVVGRLQLRYDAGLWNEWFIYFDDGSTAWLADASGQYMITRTAPTPAKLPAFDSLAPASAVNANGHSYIVTDVRTAQCVGGEGELPFKVGKGYEAKVADLRSKSDFATLDYSDTTPLFYQGTGVTLDGLKCQFLRDSDAIYRTAGQYRGAKKVLDCPHCGSPVAYQAGAATQVNCPSCASALDMSGDKALVLEVHSKQTAKYCTIELGEVATIDQNKWIVIGRLEREDEEGSLWAEYLLYHMQKGFFWLVESPDGWFKAQVLNEALTSLGGTVHYQGKSYTRISQYTARVTYAAGAFNWRVKVGDTVRVAEYKAGQANASLSFEISDSEITWSAADKVSAQTVGEWFGRAPVKSPIVQNQVEDWVKPMKWMWAEYALIWAMSGFKSFFVWLIFAIGFSVFIFVLAHSGDGDSSDSDDGDFGDSDSSSD